MHPNYTRQAFLCMTCIANDNVPAPEGDFLNTDGIWELWTEAETQDYFEQKHQRIYGDSSLSPFAKCKRFETAVHDALHRLTPQMANTMSQMLEDVKSNLRETLNRSGSEASSS